MDHWKRLSAARKSKSITSSASTASPDTDASLSTSPQLRPVGFKKQLEKSHSASGDELKFNLAENMVKDHDRAKVLHPLFNELARVKCDSEDWNRLEDFLRYHNQLSEHKYVLLNRNTLSPVDLASDIE